MEKKIEKCTKCVHRNLESFEFPCSECSCDPMGTGTESMFIEGEPLEDNPLALMKIKDSGERREFSTGAVRDVQESKGRCDLMPLDVVGEFLMNKTLIHIERFKECKNIQDLYLALEESHIFKNPFTMMLEVAKHFEAGAKKYGEYNWQKGIPVHSYIDSAVRHYLKWLRGDEDEPHDSAFVWNILCCVWTVKHKPEMMDIPRG